MQLPGRKQEIPYAQLRTGEESGFVLDTGKVIVDSDIKTAVEITNKNMLDHIEDIESSEGSGREVKKFYIGKTHICKFSDTTFNPRDHNTWALEKGINSRYTDHFDRGYGKDRLLVLAVVTEESIPQDAIAHQYIINQEEYAVILEKRIIQMYSFPENNRDPRIVNPSADAGHLDEKLSPGYVVYMAFKLGKQKK